MYSGNCSGIALMFSLPKHLKCSPYQDLGNSYFSMFTCYLQETSRFSWQHSNLGKQDSDVWCHKSRLLPWAWISAPWMRGLSTQAPFPFLSGCRYRSKREEELQLFSKLNLSYGSPADQQRSQVSSSDKEKPSRQKLFPQSLIISKNLIPTAFARFGFIIWTALLSLLTSDFESLDQEKLYWFPQSHPCMIFFLI